MVDTPMTEHKTVVVQCYYFITLTTTVDASWTDSRLAMGEDCKEDLNLTECHDLSLQILKVG